MRRIPNMRAEVVSRRELVFDAPNERGLVVAHDPKVVFVSGNHELYGESPRAVAKSAVEGRLAAFSPSVHIDNLYWLDDEVAVIDGVRFVGSTLWFADSADAQRNKWQLNDFEMIRDFEPWVYEKNAASRKFLAENVRASDVVVTHHLPSQRSVDPQYEGSPLNAFFVCDVETLIVERQPALVLHGHTHSSCDYKIGVTRVLCNPYGYEGHEVNRKFNPKLVVEV